MTSVEYSDTLREAVLATLDNVEMVTLLMDHVKGTGVWPDVLRAAARDGNVGPTLPPIHCEQLGKHSFFG